MLLTKGNYGVSWGNTNWGAQYDTGGLAAQYIDSAFGHNGAISLASVIDGTSNTVFTGEVLQGEQGDIRGVMWSSIPGGGSFMTRFTPNGVVDYLKIQVGGDYLNNAPGLFCVNEPGQGLPCTPGASDKGAFAGSRSRHAGGVNVGMGDGSVRFVKNTINPVVWIGLNSIKNGEVLKRRLLLTRPGMSFCTSVSVGLCARAPSWLSKSRRHKAICKAYGRGPARPVGGVAEPRPPAPDTLTAGSPSRCRPARP